MVIDDNWYGNITTREVFVFFFQAKSLHQDTGT